MRVITLTTDFGATDWFVGTMKGVILGINTQVQIVDVTHEISAGDIRAGAFALAASYKFFPRRTVHVVVVDPGVGSQRGAIAVQTANYFFVGPDNGVLSFALSREKIKAVRQITNERLILQPVSNTFHGRDLFAPVAAHLSKGWPIQKAGPATKGFVKIDWPEPGRSSRSITGEIVYIDRFGNAITNIDREALFAPTESPCEVLVKHTRLCQLGSFYQAAPARKPIAIFGSSGFLEIALNGGSAAKKLDLKIGDAVTLQSKSLQNSSSS